MGVYGLWRLLDAAGKQVPLETLEGKVLAIDISIWIHQVLQGYQDRFGNPKPNAHLIGLFNRICKLLYYKIKPVFVFDGGVPMLKKDTIALRRKQKSIAKNKAEQMRTELISNLIKHSAVKTVLNTEKQDATSGPSDALIDLQTKRAADDMFKLPEMPNSSKADSNVSDDYDSDSSDEPSPRKQTKWAGNIHSVDVTSAEFRVLPADVRYEILTDLKETRKQNSWGRLHEMPEESNEFSGFQMKRLLKRRLVQESLECAEKEMGGKTLTLDELDKLLTEQGISTNGTNCTYRIAGDSTTRLIYISDKNTYIKNNNLSSDSEISMNHGSNTDETVAGPSKVIPISEDINEYEFSDAWDSDIETTPVSNFTLSNEINSGTESEIEQNESRALSKKHRREIATNPALTYMLEYSGLTEKQIITLLEQNRKEARKSHDSMKMQRLISTSKHNTDSDNNTRKEIVSAETTESGRSSKTTIFETNREANVNLSSPGMTNISSVARYEGEDATTFSSADSNTDSDDFIEIQDAPVSEMVIDIDKRVPDEGIQITFRSDEKVEDDMFADVFETQNSKTVTEIKTLNFDRQESRNEISLPETLVKSSEEVDKSQQLCNTKQLEHIDARSAVKFDPDNVECTSIQPEENETKDTNINENVANCPMYDVETADIGDNISKSGQDDVAKNGNALPLTEGELLSLQAQLEDKQTELMANIGKLERQGIDISDQIRTEAQELLRLFGIPYLVAPMEAEAQCAYLEQIRLTDGTITDDSDIWLFGGQCVYKNFFDNNKKVLEFRSCEIQRHFKLTRNDMIRLALLVGSDYTTGLAGVGPVTALEILGTFPSESDDLLQGLTNFCSWIKTGRAVGPGKTGLRNKLQNLQIQKGFPSQAVVQAYLFPKVDESKETFSWGKLNNILLCDYAKQKFGWDKNKYNEIMAPVLKRLEEKKTQSTMDAYLKLQSVPKSIEMNMSKRVRTAVQKLNNENVEDSVCAEASVPQPVKKTKPSIEKGKTKRKGKHEQTVIDASESTVLNVSSREEKNVVEYIPQREKDKANALKNKLRAIEVLRKSKQGLYKTKKIKRCVRKVKEVADLSGSDSSSS